MERGKRRRRLYRKWGAEHSKVCDKNHSGSSAMMEVVGMKKIFERSIKRHGARYLQYIGDGDCKTFAAIKKSLNHMLKILTLLKLNVWGTYRKGWVPD